MKKIVSIMVLIGAMIIIIGILLLDNQKNTLNNNVVEVKAKIIETNDSNIVQTGITRIGDQRFKIEILEGQFKGQIVDGVNNLMGKLEIDNFYKPNDIIVAALLIENGEITQAKSIDLYRQNTLLILFLLFVGLIIVFARIIGLKSLMSFVASLFVIWKILIPGLLNGKNPLILAAMVLILLTAIIMFLVAGFTKKGIVAFAGTICGLSISIGITMIFGARLGLYGMTSTYAETLLYNGYMDLNMRYIFYAAIIIGASGAAMDIGMDIAASMEEIKIKKADISMQELIQSGFSVGRSVIGTMTTTLLLAYSGGYLTLLMVFMTKNSSFARIINLKIVSAEIMRTLVGSIGLVLVAPITSIIAGWVYTIEDRKN